MEMTYYTGIDVSLRSVSICVVDDKGEVCLEAKVAAEIDAIVDRLRQFSSDVKSVGFEAGTLTQYLTYGLQAAGFEVICLEARQVSVTLAAMRTRPTATTLADSHKSSGLAGTAGSTSRACTATRCELCWRAARPSSRSASTSRTSCAGC
jgi:transposase